MRSPNYELPKRLHELHQKLSAADLSREAGPEELAILLRTVFPTQQVVPSGFGVPSPAAGELFWRTGAVDSGEQSRELIFGLYEREQLLLAGILLPLIGQMITAALNVGCFVNGTRAQLGTRPGANGSLLLGVAPGTPAELSAKIHLVGSLSYCSATIGRMLVLQGILDAALTPKAERSVAPIYELLLTEAGAVTMPISESHLLFGRAEAVERLSAALASSSNAARQ